MHAPPGRDRIVGARFRTRGRWSLFLLTLRASRSSAGSRIPPDGPST